MRDKGHGELLYYTMVARSRAGAPPRSKPSGRSTGNRPPKRWLVPVGLAAACAIALVVCVFSWRAELARIGTWGFPLDDSWIHCQIARNLADGHGWSFNPGVPVQNSSGPLWTALVAIGFVIFGASLWVPKILGVLCFLACIVLAFRLAQRWTGDRGCALASAFLIATSKTLAWHSLSGMETALAAVLVLVTLAAFQGWTSGRRRFIWAVLAALAVMTRPETLVLLPLLLLERRWRNRQSAVVPASSWRDFAFAACIAGLVLLPYFLLNVHLSGSLFPTTFAAKAGDTGLASALRRGDVLEVLLSMSLYPYAWSVHTVSFWGSVNAALWLVAPIGAWVVARSSQPAVSAVILLAALPALRGMVAPHVLPTVHQGRYVGVLLPLFYICAASGLLALLRSSLPFRARKTRLLPGAALLLVVMAWVRLELRVPHVGESLSNVVDILWGRGRLTDVLDGTLTAERRGLFLAAFAPAAVLLLGVLGSRPRRLVGLGLAVGALLLQAQFLRGLPAQYANNVRDIHVMDVTLGRWVRENVPGDVSVTVNDIGAIAYFGERHIVDAIGLATPELTPYWSPRRLRTLIALRSLHPELGILFTSWFPDWVTRPALMQPLHHLYIDHATIIGGSEAAVFRLHWDLFDRYYDTALLERLDPPDAYASFQGHLRRGMRNLGLRTRAFLLSRAGDIERQRKVNARAAHDYRRAIDLDAQELNAWKGLLEVTRQNGDEASIGRLLAEMVQRLPNYSVAFEARADWQARQGDFDSAARSYDEALSLHPDNTRLLGKIEKFWNARNNPVLAETYRARRQEFDWPAPTPLVPP